MEISGRLRRTTSIFYVADAGLQYAINQVAQPVPRLTGFQQAFPNGDSFMSGSKTDTVPRNILAAGRSGAPPEGYSINIGRGFSAKQYLATVTARAPDASAVELEAKLARVQFQHGGY